MFDVAETSVASRELLIASYWYPPAIGAAAERIYSFARYLPSHGWRVRVLTADHGATLPRPPGVTVDAVPDPMAGKAPLFSDFDPRESTPGWKRFLREFMFPDRFRFWQKAAVRAIRHSLESQPPECVLASFPPASAVLAGMAARECSRSALVLDFRDRWLGPGGYQPARNRNRRAHQVLERAAVGTARGIVTVSDAMAEALASEHHFPRDRIAVIPNGYDPEPALRPPDAVASDLLTIVHVGTVIARNRPDLFFDAVRQLRKSDALATVRFRFVGNLSRGYLQASGLAPVIESTGLMPREAARREMETAPALLLLVGRYVGRWGYNAKLFEYVQTGRPVLCLEEAPGSNDAALLRQFAPERSFFATLHNPASIAAAIEALRGYLRTAPQSAFHLPPEFARFSRASLAGELAAFLGGLV